MFGAMSNCKETWGVFPCSTSLPGSFILVLVYGRVILYAANWLSDGSELLLEILDPGIIGGLVLPILGALPDAFIIAVSGLGGTQEEAQKQISIGVGTLAGSSIMLLTVAWAGSVLLGRCDLKKDGTMKNKTLTHRWNLFKTGISTDRFTPLSAMLMGASVLLYGTIQIPSILARTFHPLASLVGGIMCFVFLAGYCIFQVIYPEMQSRMMDRAKNKHRRVNAMRLMEENTSAFGNLLSFDGSLNMRTVEPMFKNFDKDNSGSIDRGELRALLLGLSISNEKGDALEEDLKYWMKEFDQDEDNVIGFDEFCNVLKKWLQERRDENRKASRRPTRGPSRIQGMRQNNGGEEIPEDERHLLARDEEEGGEEDEEKENEQDEEEDENKPPPSRTQIATLSATSQRHLAFQPSLSPLPSPPFAISAGEVVSSFQFAKRKRSKNLSLTLSQIYGAVTLNNTLCLGIFLLIVHFKHLKWTYTSEVAVTVGATLIMSLIGLRSTKFRSWMAIPVALIYPLSVFIVWFLDYVVHLDD
ncbi:hypothetical protein WJX74_003436 [Apatococcus lobatus]|uniref:EF-hand domain-containing protein n=1 Tax=Apatococcus lobatus TaxID=904363 RepID=A0AAW1QD40_9CHLO